MSCPCGSGKEYSHCCGQYLEGKDCAPTPEALMRSRYTAFSKNRLDYIEKTMRKEALEKFDGKIDSRIEWLKLDVLYSEESGNTGTVMFVAKFKCNGQEHFMHETSTFEKIEGKWYYTKGTLS